MSWYVHPSRQLRDDELPPELVVTNRDGSIEQVYMPYDATGEQLKAENAKLRELVRDMWHEGMCECGSRGKCASCEYDYPTRMRDLGIEVDE